MGRRIKLTERDIKVRELDTTTLDKFDYLIDDMAVKDRDNIGVALFKHLRNKRRLLMEFRIPRKKPGECIPVFTGCS